MSPKSPELENRNFWISLTFIFCDIVRILFQAWYVSRRGEASMWLKWQFSRKEMFIFMQKICISLSAGNTVFKLNWGWKLQNFTRYPDANVSKFLMKLEFKCNLLCLLKQMQFIAVEVFIYLFTVFISNYIAQFV